MGFSNYRKESSERSDSANWAKKALIGGTPFHYDSIEGCNENKSNIATHLMERSRVDYDGQGSSSPNEVLASIKFLEGEDVLLRKINFTKAFNLPLTYILYNDEKELVWRYEITSLSAIQFIDSYNSYQSFSDWIASIKGWESSKKFRERQDLPNFDRRLRACGTAWPTNIDCFISDQNNAPIAILEFQNADSTGVKNHCNNDFFWGKISWKDKNGNIKYHNDLRRWQSQEILRLQSGLRLFVITWSANSKDFILKEIKQITFPELPYRDNWELHREWQELLHVLAVERNTAAAKAVSRTLRSFKMEYGEKTMSKVSYCPNLVVSNLSFPQIYYVGKEYYDSAHIISDEFMRFFVKNVN